MTGENFNRKSRVASCRKIIFADREKTYFNSVEKGVPYMGGGWAGCLS